MFLDAFKDDGKDSYHSGYGYESYGYDTSGSGGYGHHRRSDFNRKSRKGKRALDDEEKAVVEMLYRILNSLSEEQVEDILNKFEKEVIKRASDYQEMLGSGYYGEDCIKRFLCGLFVSDPAMELSRSSKKMRVMSLLQDALNETDNSNSLNDIASENQNLNMLLPHSYSIYEWNDLIQMILGSRKPMNNKVEDHLFLTKEGETDQNNVTKMLKDVYSHFNTIPEKVTEYLGVQEFSIRLRKDKNAESTSSLQKSCEKQYKKCNLPFL